MLLGKTKKVIEGKETEMQLFLSNNYKDSAYKAYQEFVAIVEEFKSNGKISDKDYSKLMSKINDYKITFKDFIK